MRRCVVRGSGEDESVMSGDRVLVKEFMMRVKDMQESV